MKKTSSTTKTRASRRAAPPCSAKQMQGLLRSMLREANRVIEGKTLGKRFENLVLKADKLGVLWPNSVIKPTSGGALSPLCEGEL